VQNDGAVRMAVDDSLHDGVVIMDTSPDAAKTPQSASSSSSNAPAATNGVSAAGHTSTAGTQTQLVCLSNAKLISVQIRLHSKATNKEWDTVDLSG
jgi:hypothetical protein